MLSLIAHRGSALSFEVVTALHHESYSAVILLSDNHPATMNLIRQLISVYRQLPMILIRQFRSF